MTDRGRLYAWLGFVGVFAALNYAARFSERETDRNRPKWGYLALRRPVSWGRALGIGVLVLIGVFVLAGILEPILKPGEEQGLVPERWQPDRAGAFIFNFAVVALLAPVVEELTFRGLGFTLLERFGWFVAIPLVGILFALAHGLVEALPVLAAFGAGLAYLRARSQSVYPSMIVHAFFNSLVLIVAVST